MISVVDTGMSNIASVLNMLKRVGAEARAVRTAADVETAEKLVLPGVGHFGACMERLHAFDLVRPLDDAVRGRGVPILGICLGLQLMSRRSEEGECGGFAWIEGDVVRFRAERAPAGRIPHMGWNTIRVARPDPLFADLAPDARFYFVHSYHLLCTHDADVLAWTDYGGPFPSAVRRANISGVQFHPEKSHAFGMRVLTNFARSH